MVNTTQPSDDFFSLLEKEQKENDPVGLDEIIFKDESGKMKVLKNGQVFDYVQKVTPAESQISQKKSETKTEKQLPTVSAKVTDQNPPIVLVSRTLPTVEKDQKPEVKNVSQKNAGSFEGLAPVLSKLPQMPIRPKRQIVLNSTHSAADFARVATEVIDQVKPNFSDPDLNKRLLNIVISNLKNIRDRVETKEMLLSSPLEGGVGLGLEIAEKIIEICEVKKVELSQIKSKENTVLSDLQEEADLLLEKPVSKVESKPQEVPANQKPLIKDIKTEVKPEAPKVPEVKAKFFTKKPEVIKPEPEKFAVKDVPIKRPEIKTEPVKFTPKLLDPVEEIRTMTLRDFRLLDSDPIKAMEKIVKKVELLEEESIVQKVNGIKAWKESQPYRLYLNIGLQAMEEKCSMSEIISRQKTAGQETLSEEELEAIMELNQKLRY